MTKTTCQILEERLCSSRVTLIDGLDEQRAHALARDLNELVENKDERSYHVSYTLEDQ